MGDANKKKNFQASGSSHSQVPKSKRQKPKSNIIKVLNVAEKPGPAQEISTVMSKGVFTKIDGFRKTDIDDDKDKIPKGYLFDYIVGSYFYEMVFFSVEGHFKTLGFDHDEKYNVGDYYEPEDIFRREMVRFVPGENNGILRMLKEQALNNDQLYLWMDGDREGNRIGFDIEKECSDSNDQIETSWASSASYPPVSCTDDGLRKLIGCELHTAEESYANAVTVRQEIDRKAGTCFSIWQSRHLKAPFNIPFKSKLGFGLCRFPILSKIVKVFRYHILNRSSSSGPISYSIVGRSGNYLFKWKKKTDNEDYASNIKNGCNKNNEAVVTDIKRVHINKPGPLPLTMHQLLKQASTEYNMSISRACDAAQRLYKDNFISYHRSDSNEFRKDTDFREILKKIKTQSDYRTYIAGLLKHELAVPVRGGHMGAHQPIHPTGIYKGDKDGDMYKIYMIILRRFLACVSGEASYFEFTVEIKHHIGEFFTATAHKILQHGYLSVENNLENCVPMNQPLLKRGDKVCAKWSLTETEVNCPMKIATLIDFIEKYGIGTSATIHYHIAQLKEHNYVVEQNDRLLPTHLGEALIAGHEKVKNKLLDFNMRDEFEKELNAVCNGKMQMGDVLEKWLETLVTNYTQVATRLKEFTKAFEYFYGKSKSVTKCSGCGKADMALWQNPKDQSFIVSCPRYKNVKPTDKPIPNRCERKGYFLPKGVQEAVVTDAKCTNCRAEVFLLKVTKGGQASLYCAICTADLTAENLAALNINLADLEVNDGKCKKCSATFPDAWHEVCEHTYGGVQI